MPECCTNSPIKSGFLVYDSLGLFDKGSMSNVKIGVPDGSLIVKKSPELFIFKRFSKPLATCTIAPPKLPTGSPAPPYDPPNTTKTPFEGINDSPDGKV